MRVLKPKRPNYREMLDMLIQEECQYFFGVPDSVLKDFTKNLDSALTSSDGILNHITAVNEGAAVSMAAGLHLSTGKIPCVYMQNAGLGNAVNPLTSLVNKEVYGIPMLLIIGWRGAPSKQDEPQHLLMGRISKHMLELMDIPTIELTDGVDLNYAIKLALNETRERLSPTAILVHPDYFAKETYVEARDPQQAVPDKFEMTRTKAMSKVLDYFSQIQDCQIFATTGHTSRELMSLKESRGSDSRTDFLNVGAMGHLMSIALGFSCRTESTRKFTNLIFDGDGALLMHLGEIAQISQYKGFKDTFVHIILCNGVHDSVGGQEISDSLFDFGKSFRGVSAKPIPNVRYAFNEVGLEVALKSLKQNHYNVIQVFVTGSDIPNLPRAEKDFKSRASRIKRLYKE